MKIFDGVFTDSENTDILNHISSLPYFYGERDNPGQIPTGVIHSIEDPSLLDFLKNTIIKFDPSLENKELQRAYINLFQPGEQPNFHIDGEVTTCLIYVLPKELPLDEGGETQFFIDDQITGVLPKPKRMVIFDGNLKHRATSFRKYPRFTIAVKFWQ